MKRLTFVSVILAMILSACGSSNSSSSTSPTSPPATSKPGVSTYTAQLQKDAATTVNTTKYKKKGPYTIAALTQGPGNGWGLTYDTSIKYEAAHNPNVKKLIFAPANQDANKEITDLENIVQQKPDAIVLDPLGRAALAAPAARAMSAGIPVILCANGIQGQDFVTRPDIDIYHTGYEAAVGLAKLLHGKGNVVMFNGIAGVDAAETWKQAGLDAFSHYPHIHVVASAYANWSIATGKQDAAAMIAAHPKIDGVWSGGSEMAIGAILAFHDAGKPMPAFGVDNPLNGFLRLVKQYHIKYWAYPDPPSMSKLCLDTAIKVLQGQPVKKFIDVSNVIPGTKGYNQSATSLHYVPQLNDDFVPPATAPISAYAAAGFKRK